ncbi:MAG TPA: hypothetical protein VIN02_08220 [Sulfurovum sp.]
MYVREENIPEENLDWDKTQVREVQEKTQAEDKENKKVIHPAAKNKIVLKKKIKFSEINIKSTIQNFLDEHGELSLLISLLTFPYIIGFIIIAFILLYGGVPIDRFFSMKEGIFHFELWSIGAYIFITTGVIWLFMIIVSQRR